MRHVWSALIVLSFLAGATSASYVWGKTIERVTYQHMFECLDFKGALPK